MSADPEKILVIGPSWIGDMVMAQSLFMTLKQRYPQCRLDVLAPSWSLPLLERMPEVDHTLGINLKHGQFALPERFKIGRRLHRRDYDQVIVLPNSWKSALIPFFAIIPRRTGYVGEMRWGLLNDPRLLDKKRLKKTVERFVALAYPRSEKNVPDCPVPNLVTTEKLQTIVKNKFGIGALPLLALCPGAEYGPAKRWPAGHFAEIARQKQGEGWQVCLLGSVKDQAIAEEINELTGGACLDFAGRTHLHEAIDILSLASVVVSNDSGLMHVAAALRKKLIALYGSSDPGFTPPMHDKAIILQRQMECAPCFKRVCRYGHTRCLTDITPAMVLDAIEA